MSGHGINSPNFLGFSVGRDIGPGWLQKNFQQDTLLSGTITKKRSPAVTKKKVHPPFETFRDAIDHFLRDWVAMEVIPLTIAAFHSGAWHI